MSRLRCYTPLVSRATGEERSVGKKLQIENDAYELSLHRHVPNNGHLIGTAGLIVYLYQGTIFKIAGHFVFLENK